MEVTAPHHLRGAIWVGHHHALPACRHDPAWRNTGLRTAATPPGWRITSPFVIGSAATATSASRSSAAQSPFPLLCDGSIAIAATRLTYSQPAITQLCRGSTVSTMCVPTIRPCRPRILSLYPSRCKGSTEIIVKLGKNAQIGTKCRFFSFSGCNFVPGEGYYLEYLA